jgi:hypothetical protein
MWLEITTLVLCLIALAAVVVTLLLALSGITDPTTFVRCRECTRWMIDSHTRPEPVCFRCRHHHGHAHLTFMRRHASS